MLQIESLHHVGVCVTDVARARAFYAGVLGLRELPRPAFPFDGAWFAVGDRVLHLIAAPAEATLRDGKAVDTRDGHFALRVASWRAALTHLHALGYAPDAADDLRRTREQPDGAAGFPQVFLLDPDRNVVELNAAALD